MFMTPNMLQATSALENKLIKQDIQGTLPITSSNSLFKGVYRVEGTYTCGQACGELNGIQTVAISSCHCSGTKVGDFGVNFHPSSYSFCGVDLPNVGGFLKKQNLKYSLSDDFFINPSHRCFPLYFNADSFVWNMNIKGICFCMGDMLIWDNEPYTKKYDPIPGVGDDRISQQSFMKTKDLFKAYGYEHLYDEYIYHLKKSRIFEACDFWLRENNNEIYEHLMSWCSKSNFQYVQRTCIQIAIIPMLWNYEYHTKRRQGYIPSYAFKSYIPNSTSSWLKGIKEEVNYNYNEFNKMSGRRFTWDHEGPGGQGYNDIEFICAYTKK